MDQSGNLFFQNKRQSDYTHIEGENGLVAVLRCNITLCRIPHIECMFSRQTLLGVSCVVFAAIVHYEWCRFQISPTAPASATSKTQVHFAEQNITRRGDTTAIVLNWSRLSNVIKITSILCLPQLDETVAQVVIWNNGPQRINQSVCHVVRADRLEMLNLASDFLGMQLP